MNKSYYISDGTGIISSENLIFLKTKSGLFKIGGSPSVATEFRELIQSIKSNNYPQDIDESPLFKALYKLGGIIEVDNSKKPIIDFEVVLKNDFSSSINETLSKKAKSTKKQSICIEYFPNTGRLFVSKLFDTDSDIDINYSHKKISNEFASHICSILVESNSMINLLSDNDILVIDVLDYNHEKFCIKS